MDLLAKNKTLDPTFDDSENLTTFIYLLRFIFNYNRPLDKWFEKKLFDFFEYRWRCDRNLFLLTDKDFNLFDQLPYDT